MFNPSPERLPPDSESILSEIPLPIASERFLPVQSAGALPYVLVILPVESTSTFITESPLGIIFTCLVSPDFDHSIEFISLERLYLAACCSPVVQDK